MGKKRAYCPYCDVYLVHNSLRSRRDHLVGWKHMASFQAYYARFYSNHFKKNNFGQQEDGEQSTKTYERTDSGALKTKLTVSAIPPKIAPPPTVPAQKPTLQIGLGNLPALVPPPTVPRIGSGKQIGPPKIPSISGPPKIPSISGPPKISAPPKINSKWLK